VPGFPKSTWLLTLHVQLGRISPNRVPWNAVSYCRGADSTDSLYSRYAAPCSLELPPPTSRAELPILISAPVARNVTIPLLGPATMVPRLPLELLLDILHLTDTKTFATALYSSAALAHSLLSSMRLRARHAALLDPARLASKNKAYLLSVLLPHVGIDRHSLHSASLTGAADAVRVLLAHGAQLSPPVARRQNALTAAARHGHVEVVKLLLAHPSAEYTPDALAAAADQGHALLVAVLLADPGQQLTRTGRDLYLAFCRAIAAGEVGVAKLILHWSERCGAGLDLRQRDADGVAPLLLAAKFGRVEAVKWLLEREEVRGEIDAQDWANGWTALHWAGKGGHYEVMRILVRAGADREVLDNDRLRAGGGRGVRRQGWESFEEIENDPALRKLAVRPKFAAFQAFVDRDGRYCAVWS
jgi:ankyrin repeat protein